MIVERNMDGKKQFSTSFISDYIGDKYVRKETKRENLTVRMSLLIFFVWVDFFGGC